MLSAHKLHKSGQTLHVIASRHAPAIVNRDCGAFMRFVGREGRLWAQNDRMLENNGRLTPAWTPAAVVKHEYQIPLSPDHPPGEYTLRLGVYYSGTGERLPAWGKLGQRAHGDAASLKELAVLY